MENRSLVLLSGGLDSSMAFVHAVKNTHVAYGLTFDYGQAAAPKEIQAAKAICKHYGTGHQVLKIDFLLDTKNHPFFNNGENLPKLKQEQLDDLKVCHETAKAVWVPNRNGVMLNIAAALAEKDGLDEIFVGFNKEEAATFPDNSSDYLAVLNASLALSTLKQVKVKAPTVQQIKTEIIADLVQSDFPLQHLWSCYQSGETMCGECESCGRLKRALRTQKGIEVSQFFKN